MLVCVKLCVENFMSVTTSIMMETFAYFTSRKIFLLNLQYTVSFHCSGFTRDECEVVSGSPLQNYTGCITDGDNLAADCDGFISEDCEFYGNITVFDPKPGRIKTAEECEILCSNFTVSTYFNPYYGWRKQNYNNIKSVSRILNVR